MIERIYEYMIDHKMIERGTPVLAAVSGGADSMCLLEVLRALQSRAGIRLKVLHVHHGLRENAEDDLRHVADYCAATGIPFEAVRVDAAGYAAANGMSVEEAARYLRYEALEKAAADWDEQKRAEDEQNGSQDNQIGNREEQNTSQHRKCRIAVAHHIEDQAETVLFNLIRGSRLTGLRGMLPVNGRIIRPLLACSREEIEKFLMERGIEWQEDETNSDVRYSRNMVRQVVMPVLVKINSGAAEHIARSAEEAAETEEYLRGETERAAERCCTAEGDYDIVSIPALMKEPPLLRRRILYGVIAKRAGRKKDLSDVHVQSILRLAEKQGNGRLDVFGGVQVEKSYDKLFISRGRKDAADTGRYPLDPGEYSCRVFDFDGDLARVSRNQYTKWFDYDKIGTLPEFRTRREGDRITLDESGRTKKAARCMIDAKIPEVLRSKIVLPAFGGEILWIPAVLYGIEGAETAQAGENGRISAAYRVDGHTRRILEICWQPGENRDFRGTLPL